jgi:hypothetical protein
VEAACLLQRIVSVLDFSVFFLGVDLGPSILSKMTAPPLPFISPLSPQIESAYLIDLLASMEKKTGAGIVKALATNNGLSPTYFSYECLDFFSVSGKVYCKEFKMHTLPLFLEGPVRHMKVVNDQARAREILRLAKVSLLEILFRSHIRCGLVQWRRQAATALRAVYHL